MMCREGVRTHPGEQLPLAAFEDAARQIFQAFLCGVPTGWCPCARNQGSWPTAALCSPAPCSLLGHQQQLWSISGAVALQ